MQWEEETGGGINSSGTTGEGGFSYYGFAETPSPSFTTPTLTPTMMMEEDGLSSFFFSTPPSPSVSSFPASPFTTAPFLITSPAPPAASPAPSSSSSSASSSSTFLSATPPTASPLLGHQRSPASPLRPTSPGSTSPAFGASPGQHRGMPSTSTSATSSSASSSSSSVSPEALREMMTTLPWQRLPRDHPLFAEMRRIVARDRELGLSSSTDAALAEAILRNYGEELDRLPQLFDLGAQNPMAQQIDRLKRLKQEKARDCSSERPASQNPTTSSSSGYPNSGSMSMAPSGSPSTPSRLDVVLDDLFGELERQQTAAASSAPAASLPVQSMRPIFPPLRDGNLTSYRQSVPGGAGRITNKQRWASDDGLKEKLSRDLEDEPEEITESLQQSAVAGDKVTHDQDRVFFNFPKSPVAIRMPRAGSQSLSGSPLAFEAGKHRAQNISSPNSQQSPLSSPHDVRSDQISSPVLSPTASASHDGESSPLSAGSPTTAVSSSATSSSGSPNSASAPHSKSSLPEELVELITSPNAATIGAGLHFIKKHNYQHHYHPHHYHHHHPNRALHKPLPVEKRPKKGGAVSIGWVHRDGEVKSSEELEERPKIPLRRARHRSSPLGLSKNTEGNGLANFAIALQYMKLYRDNMYIFDPLHPIVLDESRIRYYLCTTEGMDERSVFAFSMNVMFCIGSMLYGDHKSSVEFRMRAEDLLNYLCQIPSATNDYALASGLIALSFNTLYWEMNNAKSADYLRMAINTCKRLNALNSDAYSRCLYALSFHPFTELADIQNLKKELETAKRMPYVPLTTTTSPCTMQEVQAWQKLIPVSVENLHICNAALGVISNLISGLILYKANASRFGPKANHSTLLHFLEAITALEAEINLIQANASNAFPRPTTLRAECYWMLEDKALALNWAEKFLYESIMPDSKYAVAGVSQLTGIVLNIFLRMEKYDLLNMQLQGLEEWAKLIPIVRTIQFNYLKELEQILRKSEQDSSPPLLNLTRSIEPNSQSTMDDAAGKNIFTITETEIEMLKEEGQPKAQKVHFSASPEQSVGSYMPHTKRPRSQQLQQPSTVQAGRQRFMSAPATAMPTSSLEPELTTSTLDSLVRQTAVTPAMAQIHAQMYHTPQPAQFEQFPPQSLESSPLMTLSEENLGRSLESADFDLYAEVAREMEGLMARDHLPGGNAVDASDTSQVLSTVMDASTTSAGSAFGCSWIDDEPTDASRGIDPSALNNLNNPWMQH